LIVKGVLKSRTRKKCKLILLSFTNCTVQYQDQILFQPEWGIYDMAIGESIPSVYNGVADPKAFGLKYAPPAETTHQLTYTEGELALFRQYQAVRDYREKQNDNLHDLAEYILNNHPNEWLLILELFELAQNDKELLQEIKHHIKVMDLCHSEKLLLQKGMELVK